MLIEIFVIFRRLSIARYAVLTCASNALKQVIPLGLWPSIEGFHCQKSLGKNPGVPITRLM